MVCVKIIKFIFGYMYSFGKNGGGRKECKVQKIIWISLGLHRPRMLFLQRTYGSPLFLQIGCAKSRNTAVRCVDVLLQGNFYTTDISLLETLTHLTSPWQSPTWVLSDPSQSRRAQKIHLCRCGDLGLSGGPKCQTHLFLGLGDPGTQ